MILNFECCLGVTVTHLRVWKGVHSVHSFHFTIIRNITLCLQSGLLFTESSLAVVRNGISNKTSDGMRVKWNCVEDP